MEAHKDIPIVLAQGIARFDILVDFLRDRLHILDPGPASNLEYFKGIQPFLEEHGYRVYHTSVGWADSVDERAAQLSEQIDRVLAVEKAGRVHIIAHSMGGLDARYMIVNVPGAADKVAMLTTIAGPHHGTFLADWGLGRGGRAIVEALMSHIHLDGFEDLTRESVETFNARSREAEATNRVVYQTYASYVEERDKVFLPLQLGWKLLDECEGPNDGLVPLASQEWCGQLAAADGTTKRIYQRRFPFPADHLNQCGWWDPNEPREYGSKESLLARIAEFEGRVKQVYLEIAGSAGELLKG